MTVRHFGLFTEGMDARDRIYWLVDNYNFSFERAEKWLITAEDMGYPSAN